MIIFFIEFCAFEIVGIKAIIQGCIVLAENIPTLSNDGLATVLCFTLAGLIFVVYKSIIIFEYVLRLLWRQYGKAS